MKLVVIVAFAAMVLHVGVGAHAQARECVKYDGVVVQRAGDCEGTDGGGGEVPIPFGLNARAELADGESYVLVGKVEVNPKAAGGIHDPRVRLEIDLREQLWLANAKRTQHPFYPIEGGVANWKKYDGQRIKLACKAHGRIMKNEDGNPEYVIYLEALQPLMLK